MGHASVLVVEDDDALREALRDTLDLAGYRVLDAADGQAALDILGGEAVNMVVSDVQMDKLDGHALLKEVKKRWSEVPVLLMTAHGSIEKAVAAMHDGAADYLVKPFEAEVLLNMVGRYVPGGDVVDAEYIAESPAGRELQRLAARVAQSDATVMISGESGTGKEVLARFIHRASPRAKKAFIAINCAAIPENMLEATLFGYEKGAFTGAYKASPGKFELAQGGTLLLDEISEMDLGLQAKLLRVLQEREVERLGGNQTIELDVRVLATSNRDMHREVASGNFREDLYYRLNVFPMHIPPLRERREDIVPLARQLIRRTVAKTGQVAPELTADACAQLHAHDWAGNVRELDNLLQRALIVSGGNRIEVDDLIFQAATGRGATPPPRIVECAQIEGEACADAPALGDDLKRREHGMIVDVLKNCMGNRKIAAEKLGISPRTLRYKLARMRDAGIAIPGN